MALKEINLKDLQMNPCTLLNDEWGLLSAGTKEKYNAMTVSWGGVGVMWNKPVINVYIRPQRYTKKFVDKEGFFTLSFYPAEYKKSALTILGTKSGRDTDKLKESGLTPCFIDQTVAFEEAKLVFVCKTLYHGKILPDKFIDDHYNREFYPQSDHHETYFGEILKVLVKE